MRTALGSVRAVVCVQGAHVTVSGCFTKPVVEGVRFCSGRRLVKVLTRLDHELSAEDVRRLAGLAEERLGRGRAAVAPAIGEGQMCQCGSEMVLRHQRADGSPFWGCSRYPACRLVRPM